MNRCLRRVSPMLYANWALGKAMLRIALKHARRRLGRQSGLESASQWQQCLVATGKKARRRYSQVTWTDTEHFGLCTNRLDFRFQMPVTGQRRQGSRMTELDWASLHFSFQRLLHLLAVVRLRGWPRDAAGAVSVPVLTVDNNPDRVGVDYLVTVTTKALHTVLMVVLVSLPLAPLVVARHVLATSIANTAHLHFLGGCFLGMRNWGSCVRHCR